MFWDGYKREEGLRVKGEVVEWEKPAKLGKGDEVFSVCEEGGKKLYSNRISRVTLFLLLLFWN